VAEPMGLKAVRRYPRRSQDALENRMSPIRFSEAVNDFLATLSGIRSAHTIASWYRNALASLGEYLGDRPIMQIETRDLRQWRTQLSNRTTRWESHPTRPNKDGKLSPWTLHDHVRLVRRFFGWLESEGMSESSPAKRLELPPLPDEPPKSISMPNVQKMLTVAEESPRDYALLLFFADTGARVGGVAGLTWEDVSLDKGCATVREKGHGGNHKARTVYFGKQTTKALARQREQTGGEGPVFPGQHGKALTEFGIYQALERIARRAKIKGRWNPHAFRHGFAREMLTRGASINLYVP
jgi:site-specific recombinase XerD